MLTYAMCRRGQVKIVEPDRPIEPRALQPDCQHVLVYISQVIRFFN